MQVIGNLAFIIEGQVPNDLHNLQSIFTEIQ